MSIQEINYSPSFCDNAQTACHQVAKVLGKAFCVLMNDMSNTNTLIMECKLLEAASGVADVFFSVQTNALDGFKGALKTLKGWNALGTLPTTVKQTVRAVNSCMQERIFPRFVGAFVDCIGRASVIVNKTYDVASFLENQIAVPFFKGVSAAYKSTHFQALGIGSMARLVSSSERLISYSVGGDLFGQGQVSGYGAVNYGFKTVESVSSVVFAGSMLMGGGAQLTTAASAVGAFSKGVEYVWTNIL